MVFSSLLFLLRFLPAALLVYAIVPRRWRNLVLFGFSLVFYAWGEPIYVLLMLTTIGGTYAGGMLLGHFKREGKEEAAKAALMALVGVSLLQLAFFKYGNFAIATINGLTGTGLEAADIALPIGISFYTFQSMSYAIDVYRGKADVQRDFVAFGTYVSMFPQLIAGPIVSYQTVEAQLHGRKETVEQFAEGVRRLMMGLGKKVLLANNAGALWSTVQAMNDLERPVLTAWLGLIAYAFQIYFDFSGYSDMAIGLGHMFGFRFLENFDYPYGSRSVTEFWRRWHISLGAWFREYVYIPLGGNRVARWKHVRNILTVWLLTGIWHGASWNFVAWGAYYGILLLAEKYFLGARLRQWPALLQHGYCMFFVLLGWNLFAFENMAQGLTFARSLFGGHGQGLWNGETIYLLYNHAVLLILCAIGSTRLPRRVGNRLSAGLASREPVLSALENAFYAGIFLLSVAWLVDATFNPFLYFRF